jgi:hypothetical protein
MGVEIIGESNPKPSTWQEIRNEYRWFVREAPSIIVGLLHVLAVLLLVLFVDTPMASVYQALPQVLFIAGGACVIYMVGRLVKHVTRKL